MSKHGHTSRYYADDKDIFDLLHSGRVTSAKLHEIARSRNIIMSWEETSESIIKYIHVLPFSWDQLSFLVDMLDSEGRPEHLTVDRIETKATLDQLKSAVDAVAESRKKHGQEIKALKNSKTFMEVKVHYSEFDYQKTRVRQRRERDVTIQVEEVNGEFEVRYEATGVASEIVGDILETVQKAVTDSPKRKKVELSGIRVARLRTKFFELLMDDMTDFDMYDLTDVKVERMADQPGKADETQAAAQKAAKEKKQMESKLKRVRFTGAGLFDDPDYKKFIESQFYISHVVWSAETSNDGKETLVEFVAEFTNTEEATNFRYNVKGEYERAESGEYKTFKTEMNAIRRMQLNRKLENTAYAALEKVTKEATEAPKSETTAAKKDPLK